MPGKIHLRKQRVLLSQVVGQATSGVRALIDRQGHQLEVSLPEEPVWLEADPFRIAQVIGQLLTNAANYTPPSGNIWVSAEADGEQVTFRIRDSGVGIEPESLVELGDWLSQGTEVRNTSLGALKLVRSLVELHGGTLHAHSDGPGRGAEFTLQLPTAAAKRAAREQHAAASKPQARRVLVVDDNVDAARMLAMLLQMDGHEVETADDGRIAIDRAKSFQPDMVLLDIGLPGMDGFEVARELRSDSRFDRTLIVALTGYGTEQVRQQAAQAGFDEHLLKPPSVPQLQALFSHDKLR